jgi:hypothetical protein
MQERWIFFCGILTLALHPCTVHRMLSFSRPEGINPSTNFDIIFRYNMFTQFTLQFTARPILELDTHIVISVSDSGMPDRLVDDTDGTSKRRLASPAAARPHDTMAGT